MCDVEGANGSYAGRSNDCQIQTGPRLEGAELSVRQRILHLPMMEVIPDARTSECPCWLIAQLADYYRGYLRGTIADHDCGVGLGHRGLRIGSARYALGQCTLTLLPLPPWSCNATEYLSGLARDE